MREVVNTAGHGAKKLIVARAQRAKCGWVSQMPFANQGSSVALLFEQGRQCRVCGGQAQGGTGSGLAVDRFFGGTP